MTIPSVSTKDHLDSGADDPKQARAELAALVDNVNTLRSHQLTSALTSGTNVLGVGTGLQSSGGNLVVNFGTGVGQAVQLENVGGSAGLPAVDGSQLTGVTGTLVQRVSTQDGTVATGTTTIPIGPGTAPTNTQGDEYFTRSITPKSASNILEIQVTIYLSHSANTHVVAALFQDATVNALASGLCFPGLAGVIGVITFTQTMTAGTTNAATFKLRAGGVNSGTLTINGRSAFEDLGGTLRSGIIVREYAV